MSILSDPENSFLRYGDAPWTEEEKEKRAQHGLPTSRFPRSSSTAHREYEIILELCGGSEALAQPCMRDFNAVSIDEDCTAHVAGFIAFLQELLRDYALPFTNTDMSIETTAIMSLFRFLMGCGIKFQQTDLSRDVFQTLSEFEQRFARLILFIRRDMAFDNVDPATVFATLREKGVEGVAQQTRDATTLEVYMPHRRFAASFLNTPIDTAKAMFDWLLGVFAATDTSFTPNNAKDHFINMMKTTETEPLLQRFPATQGYLRDFIVVTAKLHFRVVVTGMKIGNVVKYNNIPMLKALLTHVGEKLNLYLREAGRPMLDLSRSPDANNEDVQEAIHGPYPGLAPPFAVTLKKLGIIYNNVCAEINRERMGCDGLSMTDLVSESSDDDQFLVDDGYKAIPVDTQVGYKDPNDKFQDGFIEAIIYRGVQVRGYLIRDRATGKSVEIMRERVSLDAKGKRRATGPGRKRCAGDGAGDGAGGGAGSSGAGSSGAGSSARGGGDAQVGDMVVFGKMRGTVTSTGVLCLYVLVASGELTEDRYGYFPAQQARSVSGAAIVFGTRVSWGRATGVFQGTSMCYEVNRYDKKAKKDRVDYFPVDETRLA